MKIKLRSCHCGSKDIEILNDRDAHNYPIPIIRCKSCSCAVRDDNIDDIRELIKIWNKRDKPVWIEIEYKEL